MRDKAEQLLQELVDKGFIESACDDYAKWVATDTASTLLEIFERVLNEAHAEGWNRRQRLHTGF